MSINRRQPSLGDWFKSQGLTLVVWVFFGGTMYQQVAGNTKRLDQRVSTVTQTLKTSVEVDALRTAFLTHEAGNTGNMAVLITKFDTFLIQQNELLLLVTTNKLRIDHLEK
jgi:hypothetical protein